jgi:hypothetical protein
VADTKLSGLTEISIPDLADVLYLVDDTGPTSYKITTARLLGLLQRGACQGRHTLTTGVPVSITDVIGGSTLYWSPMDAGIVTIFDGTRWVGFVQAELSLALSGLTSGKAYDAFLSYNAGTPSLVLGTAWTNATTRAVGLTTQNGILVLSGTTTSRYVGTIYTTGTGSTEDSGGTAGTTQVGGKRFVWNYYNRRPRAMKVIDTTDSWSYDTATWRQANAAAGNKIEYVIGVQEDPVEAFLDVSASASTGDATVGIGLDSTTAPTGLVPLQYNAINNNLWTGMSTEVRLFGGIGYHYLAWLERAAAIANFLGDNGAAGQSGMVGSVMG